MAGTYDGSIKINTSLDTTNFNKSASAMMGSLKKIAGLVGAAFSTVALVKFGKQAVELASDITEVDNVVSKAFGSMRDQMDALADSAIKNLGMSRLTAYQTGSTFMSMGKSMLDSSEDAATMAIELTKLTGNMSSFYNKSQDLVSLALKSVYTGETETLKQYGIVMTEVNLKQFALEQGITKAYSAMTQSEKVMLRYKYVMQQTAFIGDDFIDTQDSWANQTRILKEQWKEFLSVVGTGLITVLTPVVKALNNIVGALITFANTVGTVLSKIFGIKAQTLSVADSASSAADSYDDAADAATGYGEAASDAADETAKAAKKMKGSLSGIDELNTINTSSSSSSGSGSSGGSTGGGITSSMIDELDNAEPKMGWVDKIASKFEPLQKAIDNFKASLEPLKTFTAKGWEDFYNNFLLPIGNWTLGTALPTLIQGVADFNNNVDWNKLNAALERFWKALEPFAENVGEGLLWLYKNVLVPLNTWVVSDVVPAFLDILSGAIGVVNKALEDLAPIWQWFWDNVLSKIAEFVGDAFVGFLKAFADMLDKIKENEVAMSIIEGIAIAIGLVAGALCAFNVVAAIASGLATVLGVAIAILTSPITLVVAAIAALVAAGVLLYKNWDTIKKKAVEFKNSVVESFNRLKTQVLNTISQWKIKLSNAWDTIKDTALKTFNSLKTGIINIFKNIWKGIKGVINSILGGIESMANGVIKGINTIINALNKLSFTIPDWVPEFGGKSLGFNINNIKEISIPKLANGGITTGSTLANIGEAGREAVLPLENNLGYLDAFAEKIASKINGSATVRIVPDDRNIFKVVVEQEKHNYNMTGNPVFVH